jgi:hypothetical protein
MGPLPKRLTYAGLILAGGGMYLASRLQDMEPPTLPLIAIVAGVVLILVATCMRTYKEVKELPSEKTNNDSEQ